MSFSLTDPRFNDQKLVIDFDRYRNDRVAISSVTDGDMPEPWAVFSVNIPDMVIPVDCVFIKDYGKNEGVAAMLIQGGIIEPGPVASKKLDYVEIHAYRLTPEAKLEAGLMEVDAPVRRPSP